jgi:hypothetical protein
MFIGLGALPQLESMPTAVLEYANPAPTGGDSSSHVPDERHVSNIATVPITEEPSIITPTPQKPTAAHVADKPRRQTQSRRDFAVVLPASPSIMDNGR